MKIWITVIFQIRIFTERLRDFGEGAVERARLLGLLSLEQSRLNLGFFQKI